MGLLPVLLWLSVPWQGAAAGGFELCTPEMTAAILVPAGESECVRLAAADLAGDVERITGRRPAIVGRLEECGAHAVVLATLARPESAKLLDRLGAATADGLAGGLAAGLAGKWEAYRVESVATNAAPIEHALVIAGSDERGTMFGLYAFAEGYLGVAPLHFWADRPPAKRDTLAWDNVSLAAGEPTFRYRGWFINDEDLLTEWYDDGGKRDIEYPFYHQVTSPKASAPLFEAMLRLRMNLVIPASFVDIRNPAEKRLLDDATRRGLLVTMHHIEPLGVSGFGFADYWRDKGENVPFSFVRHRDKFEAVWRDYARRWAAYGDRVVWQLGLRGIADRPVWVSDPSAPKTPAARGKLISDAMKLQWEIVREVDRRPEPPATTTLWMEGSELHRAGHLEFPPGVAVIFADNSPGWQLQRDFYEVPRESGRPYGIYYHHQLWGTGPHLVQGVSPQRAHGIFKLAVERGATHYAMLNVSNVREFVLGIDASARFLRDFEGFAPDGYLCDWCRERFAPAAEEAEECYRRLFDSFVEPDTGSRRMLDGEVRSKGLRFLKAVLDRAGQEKPWQQPERVEALRRRVAAQRRDVDAAGEKIDAVLAKLDGPARRFFENNFVAQWKIMRGLLEWLERSLDAGLLLQEGDRNAAVARLREAAAAFDTVREGKALASRGKWANWYRGDKKMNLPAAEELTQEVVETVARAAGDGESR